MFEDEQQHSETISAGTAARLESLPMAAMHAPTRGSGDALSESLHGDLSDAECLGRLWVCSAPQPVYVLDLNSLSLVLMVFSS